MPAPDDPTKIIPPPDPIIAAVMQMNAGFDNSDYAKRPLGRLGKAELYLVVFKGQDRSTWYQNYACQIGQKVFAGLSLEQLLVKANDSIIPSLRDPDVVKLAMISLLAVMFSIATIWEVAIWPHNPALQVLSGIATLLIGYLVGKSPSQ